MCLHFCEVCETVPAFDELWCEGGFSICTHCLEEAIHTGDTDGLEENIEEYEWREQQRNKRLEIFQWSK